MSRLDRVGIVGGGVIGLAHAWSASQRGYRVTLFERDRRAAGASIRNFGMIWPIGQPPGLVRDTALLSRRRWLQLAELAGIWLRPCGSIHLAHHADEAAVLGEFAERAAGSGYDCQWLEPNEVLARSPAARPEGLLGGLFSPTELCVDPRSVIARLPQWLADECGVDCQFQTTITQIDDRRLSSSDGRSWQFDRIVICSGSDLQTLFPELLQSSELTICKLQMLKTKPSPASWQLGPHLASGLTLRHYANFEICENLANLRRRIADETPELDRFGIHVMASQNSAGEIVLGDSHEYGQQIEPFDKSLIDELILRELQKIIRLPDWTIAERWHGHYVKLPGAPWYAAEPHSGVHIRTGFGGSGMTLSLGAAERFWEQHG